MVLKMVLVMMVVMAVMHGNSGKVVKVVMCWWQ